MIDTFATIGVLCWLAIKSEIDPRLIVAMLMIAAGHLAACWEIEQYVAWVQAREAAEEAVTNSQDRTLEQ